VQFSRQSDHDLARVLPKWIPTMMEKKLERQKKLM